MLSNRDNNYRDLIASYNGLAAEYRELRREISYIRDVITTLADRQVTLDGWIVRSLGKKKLESQLKVIPKPPREPPRGRNDPPDIPIFRD